MKVLHLSSRDVVGGAAVASYRLHNGLLNHGVDSHMLVQYKSVSIDSISGVGSRFRANISYFLDSLPVYISRCKRGTTFSPAYFPDRIIENVDRLSPDIIHLHWINGGFLRVETLLELNKPIVWTLHDMWPYTGGCHYSGECSRYTDSCGCCPELGSTSLNDLSHRIWKRKLAAWNRLPINFIAPSNWMAKCVKSSSLFSKADVSVIPNCIDTTEYAPSDRVNARDFLGLPVDKRLILFGAMSPMGDPRKGYQSLLNALKYLVEKGLGEDTELIVYGSTKTEMNSCLGMKIHYFGHLNNQKTMVLLNSAADVFIAPSIQDNLPNTVVEALSCGTPCVAFNIGGMPDLITQGVNGYLAKPFESVDLANGIIWVLSDEQRMMELSRASRKVIENKLSMHTVVDRHIRLYKEMLGSK